MPYKQVQSHLLSSAWSWCALILWSILTVLIYQPWIEWYFMEQPRNISFLTYYRTIVEERNRRPATSFTFLEAKTWNKRWRFRKFQKRASYFLSFSRFMAGVDMPLDRLIIPLEARDEASDASLSTFRWAAAGAAAPLVPSKRSIVSSLNFQRTARSHCASCLSAHIYFITDRLLLSLHWQHVSV